MFVKVLQYYITVPVCVTVVLVSWYLLPPKQNT